MWILSISSVARNEMDNHFSTESRAKDDLSHHLHISTSSGQVDITAQRGHEQASFTF